MREPDPDWATLATTMLERSPRIIAEAGTAIQPRLSELYDEAAEWREQLNPNIVRTRTPDYADAFRRLAHAVVMAVSARWDATPSEPAADAYFAEKVGAATDALAAAGDALAHHYRSGKITD